MITNINDLNAELAKLIEQLKNEEIAPNIAAEINKSSANIIRSCQVQINYALARGEKPLIQLLCKQPLDVAA